MQSVQSIFDNHEIGGSIFFTVETSIYQKVANAFVEQFSDISVSVVPFAFDCHKQHIRALARLIAAVDEYSADNAVVAKQFAVYCF